MDSWSKATLLVLVELNPRLIMNVVGFTCGQAHSITGAAII